MAEGRDLVAQLRALGLQPADVGMLFASLPSTLTRVDVGLHATQRSDSAPTPSWSATTAMSFAFEGYFGRVLALQPDSALTQRGINFLRHCGIQSTQEDAAPNIDRFTVLVHDERR